MKTKPPLSIPAPVSVLEAIEQSAALTHLQQAVHESNRRFEAIRGVLPAALEPHVRPGPVDAAGWSLLAANAAVAAKLRQLQPRLEEALVERGWGLKKIRVKVHASRG